MSKDYDRSIHINPSAQAWAKFFMDTLESRRIQKVIQEDFITEDFMIGWFANAMMAQHDHIYQKAKKELKPGLLDLAEIEQRIARYANDPEIWGIKQLANTVASLVEENRKLREELHL